ncbi:MAG: hypothetical protein ABSE48_14120 [Verrucomicrobiota bacterium]|jgi:hypothetical protein
MIDLTANGVVTGIGYSGGATFDNAGVLNISAGPNPATIADNFINSGNVSVNSGTLSLSALEAQMTGSMMLN